MEIIDRQEVPWMDGWMHVRWCVWMYAIWMDVRVYACVVTDMYVGTISAIG